ncbi:MAG: helix-turn-helix transcriptional regulator [Candidatus Poseidoniaceae archaeon]|nr:helix-turn-helix transcriptional regulator [Candidatus Poseidoniaceae archaeon]MBL6889930.1 helix-turn-helix transcriptional regulator [Candidatus Poseidoniaceae archaeon]|tara:strand:- start:316 stop:801 length:486 start_codon:yes stop_codon:yes gene_type:complete
MTRVRTDPLIAALTHPTRRRAYEVLLQVEEMSTVQLQDQVSVDRYNLYHHLKRLVKVGLIENHRDVGRARWWRVSKRVELPGMISEQSTQVIATGSPLDDIAALTHVHSIDLVNSRGQVGAKQFVQQLAQEYNIPLDLPWNFLPVKLILVGKGGDDGESSS